jgi:hypothetical protein
MITQVNIKNLASYELGMERGIEKITTQLLLSLSPEQVAELTDLPVVQNKSRNVVTEHGMQEVSLSEEKSIKQCLKEALIEIVSPDILEGMYPYDLGIEKGMEKIIKQLLLTLSPEQIAKLTDLPLDKIMEIKSKTEH